MEYMLSITNLENAVFSPNTEQTQLVHSYDCHAGDGRMHFYT